MNQFKSFEAAEKFGEKMIHYEEERSVKMIRERAFVLPHELLSNILDFDTVFLLLSQISKIG